MRMKGVENGDVNEGVVAHMRVLSINCIRFRGMMTPGPASKLEKGAG